MIDRPFADKLLLGERIVWEGRPDGNIRFMGRDAFLISFSAVWCGFAIFWTSSVAAMRGPVFMILWGLMFVAVGLFVSVGRFFADAWIRRQTSYALTDRRVLIVRTGPLKSLSAMSLSQLPDAQLTETRGGRGSIRFGPSRPIFGSAFGGGGGFGIWLPSLDPAPQFLGINDARRVFDIVQRSTSGERH